MLKSFEASGKTVEEAIDNALALANATIEDADIEVLELGGRGVFGLVKKDARVRITLDIPEEKKRPVREKNVRPQTKEAVLQTAEEDVPQITEMIRQRPAEAREEGSNNKGRRRGRSKAVSSQDTVIEREALKESKTNTAEPRGTDADDLARAARTFLDPVFAGLNVQPKQETQIKDGIVWLVLSGPGLGSLIGRRGETLNALQYLTNLAVNKDRKEHIRLVLDVEGYRAGREETLVTLAKKMAEKAVRSGRRVELEPMNPHERRIVHIALQNDKRVDTASHGEEPYRRVVITRRRHEAGPKVEHNKENQQKRRGNHSRSAEKNACRE
ncbi:MAG: Jag N-terminal domain-containing protein, partial [Clostridiales bacterium]|nr:Jag N-terminal domain-containing protein [Clostridiales bacterium]